METNSERLRDMAHHLLTQERKFPDYDPFYVDPEYLEKLQNPGAHLPRVSDEAAAKLWHKLANEYAQKTKGIDYVMTDELREVVNKVYKTMVADSKKGVLLIGNIGSGKSAVLEIFRTWIRSFDNLQEKRYRSVSCLDIVSEYEQQGEASLDIYRTGNWYFDDLGTEEMAHHYGKKSEIMRPLLEKRYLQFCNQGFITHATSNLPVRKKPGQNRTTDLLTRYGGRMESRIHEMFNVIICGNADSIDFRKHKP